jgi:membrane protein DedA with SNARE-associated domain
MLALGAIISISSSLGYLLPAIIGLESLGLPSPGETALVLAAVLASQGKLEIWLVILIGVSSAIVGDNLGYLLGRRFGREVLEAKGPFRQRRVKVIAAGDRFFGVAGRDQRDALSPVLLLECARRDHLGRDLRPGRLLRG